MVLVYIPENLPHKLKKTKTNIGLHSSDDSVTWHYFVVAILFLGGHFENCFGIILGIDYTMMSYSCTKFGAFNPKATIQQLGTHTKMCYY